MRVDLFQRLLTASIAVYEQEMNYRGGLPQNVVLVEKIDDGR